MKIIRDTLLLSFALFGACVVIYALGWVGALFAACAVGANQLMKWENDRGSDS